MLRPPFGALGLLLKVSDLLGGAQAALGAVWGRLCVCVPLSCPCPLRSVSLPGDAPPAEKKYKPLNTAPNSTKEIKVKIIPPQRESWGHGGHLGCVLGGMIWVLFG